MNVIERVRRKAMGWPWVRTAGYWPAAEHSAIRNWKYSTSGSNWKHLPGDGKRFYCKHTVSIHRAHHQVQLLFCWSSKDSFIDSLEKYAHLSSDRVPLTVNNILVMTCRFPLKINKYQFHIGIVSKNNLFLSHQQVLRLAEFLRHYRIVMWMLENHFVNTNLPFICISQWKSQKEANRAVTAAASRFSCKAAF